MIFTVMNVRFVGSLLIPQQIKYVKLCNRINHSGFKKFAAPTKNKALTKKYTILPVYRGSKSNYGSKIYWLIYLRFLWGDRRELNP